MVDMKWRKSGGFFTVFTCAGALVPHGASSRDARGCAGFRNHVEVGVQAEAIRCAHYRPGDTLDLPEAWTTQRPHCALQREGDS
jgi:hypothetical protein